MLRTSYREDGKVKHKTVLNLSICSHEEIATNMDLTAQEALAELEAIRMQEVKLGDATIQNIPIPTETAKEILKNSSITLPKVFPKNTANVHTKKKLQSERKHK